MALRRLYAPFRPDLNKFLFAAVGEERNGIPLSMMSALAIAFILMLSQHNLPFSDQRPQPAIETPANSR